MSQSPSHFISQSNTIRKQKKNTREKAQPLSLLFSFPCGPHLYTFLLSPATKKRTQRQPAIISSLSLVTATSTPTSTSPPPSKPIAVQHESRLAPLGHAFATDHHPFSSSLCSTPPPLPGWGSSVVSSTLASTPDARWHCCLLPLLTTVPPCWIVLCSRLHPSNQICCCCWM